MKNDVAEKNDNLYLDNERNKESYRNKYSILFFEYDADSVMFSSVYIFHGLIRGDTALVI
jgi:hypothetical protein